MRTRILPAGKSKKIIVNRHRIKSNKKDDANLPPISVKCVKETLHGHNTRILGPSTIQYSPEKPLNCGATLWIETKAEVHVIDKGADSSGISQLTLDLYSHRQ